MPANANNGRNLRMALAHQKAGVKEENVTIIDLPDQQFLRVTEGHSSRNLWSSLA